MLRICRNDPTSDYLVYTYCGYKIAKYVHKVVGRQVNLYDSDEKLMHLAKNCPRNIRIISLMDRCNCMKTDSIGLNLARSGTLIETGGLSMSYSHINPLKPESEKSFADNVTKVALNLTKSDSEAKALVEFPSMQGKYFRMAFEEQIPSFIDYTLNKVSINLN